MRALKKQQRDKVEELKKKTGYYSTRNLLEKYDEGIKKVHLASSRVWKEELTWWSSA